MHTYKQTEGYYKSLAKSNQKKIESGYCKRYEQTEKRKEYKREYEKTRLEYKREWQRKKLASGRNAVRKSAY
jgi:predicted PP-loop superfamily ATPase